MTMFHEVFKRQKQYNEEIRSFEEWTKDEWTEKYLLGLVSEIDDILDSIKWKRHRQNGGYVARANVGYDLADLTKYVLSLWELWGFDADAVIHFVNDKSAVLEELYRQEFMAIPNDRLIVITDIDGTLGDWRRTFIDWALATKSVSMERIDEATSLQLDSDLALRYPDYYKLKEDFESSGNYRNIILYPDTTPFLEWLKQEFDAFIIAHTARPWQRYYRIWGDTWGWITDNKFPIDQLRIGSDSRVLLATQLGGDNVLMLEDDPGLMLRAAHSGIRVIAREHPYNMGVKHEHIRMVGRLTDAKESIRNDFRTCQSNSEKSTRKSS